MYVYMRRTKLLTHQASLRGTITELAQGHGVPGSDAVRCGGR